MADSEQTGKVVAQDGKWWWRKPNDPVRNGPFGSASEAAAAARKAGNRVDADMTSSSKQDASPGQYRWSMKVLGKDGRERTITVTGTGPKYDNEWDALVAWQRENPGQEVLSLKRMDSSDKLDAICDSVENLTKRFDARLSKRDTD